MNATGTLSPETLLAWMNSQGGAASVADLEEFLRSHDRPDTFRLARRRCALLRRVDDAAYRALVRDLDGAPSLPELVGAGGFEPEGPGLWRIEEPVRQRFLNEWLAPGEQESWQRLHAGLAEHYAARGGPDAALDRLHHLAACDPEETARAYEAEFAQADAAFDLSRCQALLDILHRQARWIGPRLAAVLRRDRPYLQARHLFYEDYFRTAGFLERATLTRAWDDFIANDPGTRWIFHLHATGGMGKTHFLRWLIARRLVPRRVPCARVDFDDFQLVEVMSRPARLLFDVFDQLDRQLPGSPLTSFLPRLGEDARRPGAGTVPMEVILRTLGGAGIDSDLVILLDTLEEATLANAEWLAACIRQFAELRQALPRLRLVLSGRYNLADRLPAFPGPQAVIHEVARFSGNEAETSLLRQGVPNAGIRQAIARRSDGNPFKLNLLAEIALNRPDLTPADLDALPRVDLAYLIERIVLRIPQQPLRWIVRYGALPRKLTRDFIGEVLLPPLRRALSGSSRADRPSPFRRGRTGQPIDVWHPDPAALDALNLDRLWEDLCRYARQRGWIEPAGDAVRFHPEVVHPTRDLLRDQPIHTPLHRAAAAHFASLAARSPDDTTRAAHLREATFHRFHAGDPDASSQWEAGVLALATRHLDAALELATEPLEPDYRAPDAADAADAAGSGPTPIVPPLTRLRAHELAAQLHLRRAGLQPLADSAEWTAFRNHVELATRLAATHALREVSPGLVALLASAMDTDPESALESLARHVANAVDDPDAALLGIQLAARRALSDPLAAIDDFRRAVERVRHDPAAATLASDILVRISELLSATLLSPGGAGTRNYRKAQSALEEARRAEASADPKRELDLRIRSAELALDVDDVATAAQLIEKLHLPPRRTGRRPVLGDQRTRDPRQHLLEARVALAHEDPLAALRSLEHLLPGSPESSQLAGQAHELAARAHAGLFAVAPAFQSLEYADKFHHDADDPAAPGRILLARLDFLVHVIGDIGSALNQISQSERLRTTLSPVQSADLDNLHALCLHRAGDSDTARTLLAQRAEATDAPPLARAKRAFVRAALAPETSAMRSLLQVARQAIAEVEPRTARLAALEFLHALPRHPEPHPTAARSVATALPRPQRGDPLELRYFLRCFDLHRAFGREEDAAKALQGAQDALGAFPGMNASPARSLAFLLATARWPGPGAQRRLVLDFWEAENASPPWPTDCQPVVWILEAEQLLHEHENTRAAERLAQAGNAFASRAEDLWTVRLLELALRVRDTLPPDSPAFQEGDNSEIVSEIDRLRRRLGYPPRTKPGEADGSGRSEPPPESAPARSPAPADSGSDLIVRLPAVIPGLTPTGAPLVWEPLIDALHTRPYETMAELGEYVASGMPPTGPALRVARLCIETGPSHALPWELTRCLRDHPPVLVRFPAPLAGSTRPTPPTPSGPSHVYLLRARRQPARRGSIEMETTQGWSIENGYYRAFPGRFEPVEGPSPTELLALFQRQPPSVLHIAVALREYGGGTFLDFASAEDRTFSRRGIDRDFWTITLLDQLLAKLPRPPFVILDAIHPLNASEAIRMLLLRNQFAADLFAFGHTAGVLATGLAEPGASPRAYMNLADALASGAGPADVLKAMLDASLERERHPLERPLSAFPEASLAYSHTPDSPVMPLAQ